MLVKELTISFLKIAVLDERFRIDLPAGVLRAFSSESSSYWDRASAIRLSLSIVPIIARRSPRRAFMAALPPFRNDVLPSLPEIL